MSLSRIRLELARDAENPQGNPHRGYEVTAPLDEEGHLASDEWEANRSRCSVTRFWDGARTELGLLVHGPGDVWRFDYEFDEEDDDEVGFRFGDHRFVPGDYVSVRERDAKLKTFRVASVETIDR